MTQSPHRQRQAACPCGSRRSLSACCLPWEEAFQRLFSRLLAFASNPRLRRQEASAAAVFWNTQRPLQSGQGRATGESLRFLEWFLHDDLSRRGSGPLLAEFADAAGGLDFWEEALAFASFLAPVRAYEVSETLGLCGFLAKDLLTGGEHAVGPLGLAEPPIRSDVMICRLVPMGRLTRLGASLLLLPAAGREELLAYLRATYRLARPARHVPLEDFLDGSAHLYHHFFLLRGRDLGGSARETLRLAAFAPCRMTYRATDVLRIRAGLDRQPELEREADSGDEVRYAWIDLHRAVIRTSVQVGPNGVQVRADTREDLAEARQFVEACLRGLIEPAGECAEESPGSAADDALRAKAGVPGTAFLTRVLERWPDTPCPLLDNRTPREACRSRPGRQRVVTLLLDLERKLARLKRLGRAWADVTPLREGLNLLPDSASGLTA